MRIATDLTRPDKLRRGFGGACGVVKERGRVIVGTGPPFHITRSVEHPFARGLNYDSGRKLGGTRVVPCCHGSAVRWIREFVDEDLADMRRW